MWATAHSRSLSTVDQDADRRGGNDVHARHDESGSGNGGRGTSTASEAEDGEAEDGAKERRPLLDHTPTHAPLLALNQPPAMQTGATLASEQPHPVASPPGSAAGQHQSSLHVKLPSHSAANGVGSSVDGGHRRPSGGGSGSKLLLPTSFLPLSASSDDAALSPNAAGGSLIGTSGLLAAAGLAGSNLVTPRDSPHTHATLHSDHLHAQQMHRMREGGTALTPQRSWLERVITSWLADDSSPDPSRPVSGRGGMPDSRGLSPSLRTTPSPHVSQSPELDGDADEATTVAAATTQGWTCGSLALLCIWALLGVLLLLLAVGGIEYYLDSQAHSARMALLEVPSPAAPLSGSGMDPSVPASAAFQTSSNIMTSHPLDYDSLLALHERSLSGAKELNKRLVDLADREAKIHYLTSELANRDLLLANYRVVVARLKALKAEHAQMEKRLATEQMEMMLRQQLGLPTDPSATGTGTGGGGSDSNMAYRTRLLSLILGGNSTDASRSELGLGMTDLEHTEEIAKLVREEKEAQAAAAREGFLALASRAAHGDAAGGAELKVQSVMRVSEDDEEGGGGGGGGLLNGGGSDGLDGDGNIKVLAPADKLIDANKNEYILSKPGDAAAGGGKKTVDTRLVTDLGIVIVASAIGGLLAAAVHQPVLLGYLAGGSAVGPGGLRLIGQFIQIETLAAFGATFLLFALGVEFSLSKLRRVKHVALWGGLMQLVSITAVTSVVCVFFLDLRLSSSLFIGCVLSMSSTTVVVKSLMTSKQIATLGGQVMLGLLIAQDLFLSVMLAMLHLARVAPDRLAAESLWLLLRFALLAAVVVACMYVWPVLLRLLDASKSADLFLLGLVALCVFLTVVSERVIHSAEVGAFLSGILISSSPGANPELTHRCLRLFAPIRDMFGALFFSSIGMLIDPLFLVHNAGNIMLVVLATVIVSGTQQAHVHHSTETRVDPFLPVLPLFSSVPMLLCLCFLFLCLCCAVEECADVADRQGVWLQSRHRPSYRPGFGTSGRVCLRAGEHRSVGRIAVARSVFPAARSNGRLHPRHTGHSQAQQLARGVHANRRSQSACTRGASGLNNRSF
jgi:Kef-type K+ transport system membrane component KefB